MTISISLEAAGRELHIDIRGMLFTVPVEDGVVQRRDVIDVACDARLVMLELGALYRHIEGFGVTLDGSGYNVRF